MVKTFGQDILVEDKDKQAMRKELQKFIEKLVFEVETCSPEPIPGQPCIVDVTTKEFFNYGEDGTVETVIQNYKNSRLGIGMKYRYSVKEGVRFDEFKLGNQIVSLSMTGGSMAVRANDTEGTANELYTNFKSQAAKDLIHWQVYNKDLMIHYDHKEKLFVPPKTKVTATITTTSKKFEQDYTLRFRCRKDTSILVKYYSRCQRMCSCFSCCCGPTRGRIFPKDILQDLPSFQQDDLYCWFSSNGTLIWLGEECSVKINQESLI